MKRYKSKFEEKLLDIKRIQGIDSLKDTEIYINPKSVNGFPKGVRGVLDKKGNIYLWDNLNVIHTEMFPYLIQNNYINLPDSYKKPKYKILLDTLNYGVVAIQESLKQRGLFYYSESYGYDLAENLKQKIEILFNKAKKKNSQFEFVNTHFWRENNKIGRYKSYFRETSWKDAHLKYFKQVSDKETNFAEVFISTAEPKNINKNGLVGFKRYKVKPFKVKSIYGENEYDTLYSYIFALSDKRYADKKYEEPFKYINSNQTYWALRYDLDAQELFSPIDFFIHKTPEPVKKIAMEIIKKLK